MQRCEPVSWREKYPILHRFICVIVAIIGSIMIGATSGVGFTLMPSPVFILISAGAIWIVAALMKDLLGRRAIFLGLFLGMASAWGVWLGWHTAIDWPNFAAAREFGKLSPLEWPEHFSKLLYDRKHINAPFETWLIAWFWIFEIGMFLVAGVWGAWRGLNILGKKS